MRLPIFRLTRLCRLFPVSHCSMSEQSDCPVAALTNMAKNVLSHVTSFLMRKSC